MPQLRLLFDFSWKTNVDNNRYWQSKRLEDKNKEGVDHGEQFSMSPISHLGKKMLQVDVENIPVHDGNIICATDPLFG